MKNERDSECREVQISHALSRPSLRKITQNGSAVMRRENSEEKFYCLAPWSICYPAARMRMHAFTSGLGSYRMLLNDLYQYTFFSRQHRATSGDVLFLRRQSRTYPQWDIASVLCVYHLSIGKI